MTTEPLKSFKVVESAEKKPALEKPFNNRPLAQSLQSEWTFKDYFGAFLSRISYFRNNYAVKPGLYKIGNPDKESEVLVTANYKLSLDTLRKYLKNLDLWILVIDTKGINVWCAAGKGTFGTKELVNRIFSTGLTGFIDHKRIILPQLGAPGVNAHEVKKQTGLRVHYGPVNAKDIPEYLKNNRQAPESMRLVKFGFLDRLILIPMELIPALKYLFYYSAGIFIIMGLNKEGILFQNGITYGLPFFIAGLVSIIAGTFFTPAFLPFVPFRAFSLKGFITGTISAGLLTYFTGLYQHNLVLLLFIFTFIPAISSFTALQFTGSSTYTNHSGVEKEHKYALPVYAVVLIFSVILTGIYKFQKLGLL